MTTRTFFLRGTALALSLVGFVALAGCSGAGAGDDVIDSNDELAASATLTPSALRGRWEREIKAGVTGAFTFGSDGNYVVEHHDGRTTDLGGGTYRVQRGKLLLDDEAEPSYEASVTGSGSRRKLTLSKKDEHGEVGEATYHVGSDDSLPMPEALRGKWTKAPGPRGIEDLELRADAHFTWKEGSDPLGCGSESGCDRTSAGLVVSIKEKDDSHGQLVLEGERTFNYTVDGDALTLNGTSGTSGKHSLVRKGR
jgi:hypothetical protein